MYSLRRCFSESAASSDCACSREVSNVGFLPDRIWSAVATKSIFGCSVDAIFSECKYVLSSTVIEESRAIDGLS